MNEDLMVFLFVAGILILAGLFSWVMDRNKKKKVSESTAIQTLFLEGFRPLDRVIVIKGDYMNRRGKILSLWEDDCPDSLYDFGYVFIQLDEVPDNPNEDKIQRVYITQIMHEKDWDEGESNRGKLKATLRIIE